MVKWCLWFKKFCSVWIWKQMLILRDQRSAEEELPLSCVMSKSCDLCFQSLLASADPKFCLGFAFKACSPTPRWVLEPFSLHISLHRHALAWLLLSALFKCFPFQPWDLQTALSHTEKHPSVRRERNWELLLCRNSFAQHLRACSFHFTSEPGASFHLQSLRREKPDCPGAANTLWEQQRMSGFPVYPVVTPVTLV